MKGEPPDGLGADARAIDAHATQDDAPTLRERESRPGEPPIRDSHGMQVPRCLACEATWPGWGAGSLLSFRRPLKLSTFDTFAFVEQGTLPAAACHCRLLYGFAFRGRPLAVISTVPLHQQGTVDSQPSWHAPITPSFCHPSCGASGLLQAKALWS